MLSNKSTVLWIWSGLDMFKTMSLRNVAGLDRAHTLVFLLLLCWHDCSVNAVQPVNQLISPGDLLWSCLLDDKMSSGESKGPCQRSSPLVGHKQDRANLFKSDISEERGPVTLATWSSWFLCLRNISSNLSSNLSWSCGMVDWLRYPQSVLVAIWIRPAEGSEEEQYISFCASNTFSREPNTKLVFPPRRTVGWFNTMTTGKWRQTAITLSQFNYTLCSRLLCWKYLEKK